ncbi:probable protein phosphatase 2C 8 [Amaranthus tricolor]|uniref:probable protein phosphatase 2C 8 n=1 Tax=Amaranthus tricolor TaxID=29722 RepID=UPI0025866DD6|nr:probable protein phosphatase 2C 8 [Amaranthus tricolor]
MTLREISMQEGISSSVAHTAKIDPQRAKISRRQRVEIQRLKSVCQAPKYGVVTCKNEDNCVVQHGVVSVMGRRRAMEDTVRVEKDLVSRKYDYFGVYDGHGGSHVAEACRDRMHAILREEMERWKTCRKMNSCDDHEDIDWEKVMGRCFERMDEEVGRGEKGENVEEMTVGSTVVVAVVGKEEVVVANCGDSRAVICRNGVAVPLSLDHKPDRPDELARIEAAGGRVINWNGHRILGVLATSRSIGDYYLKPYVSSTPEVMISKRTEADEFLVLASDGLWDVVSNEVACQVVRRCLNRKIKSQEILNRINKISSNRAEVAAVLLTELAIAKGSKDNISVIVVDLRKFSRCTCS